MQDKDLKQKLENKVECEKVFTKAASKARLMVKRKVLNDSETAELKGLFQQATVGDGNYWKLLNDPKFFVTTDGVTKNQTWLPLRGMPKVEAMERYIEMVDSLSAKYYVIFPSSRAGSYSSLASGATAYTYVPH